MPDDDFDVRMGRSITAAYWVVPPIATDHNTLSVGCELDPHYFDLARKRVFGSTDMFTDAKIDVHE